MLTYSPAATIEERFSINAPSPLQRIRPEWTRFNSKQVGTEITNMRHVDAVHEVEIWCKRDDLLHPIISGNKWRKLLKPLQTFVRKPPVHIVSFGGPYSNHLHALSYCCKELGIPFTAVIRGAYLQHQTRNPCLQDLQDWNTNLLFVDKPTYKKRTQARYLEQLCAELGADTVIPEGGSQQDALYGMQSMLAEIKSANKSKAFDAIFIPVGSGASMAGIIQHCTTDIASKIIGIGTLQGEQYLNDLVQQFLPDRQNKDTPYLPWHINHDFHFGGYAKTNTELNTFCNDFNKDTPIYATKADNKDTPILIERVYSGKCFYALKSLIQKGEFAPNSKILVIHTGGLQGRRP